MAAKPYSARTVFCGHAIADPALAPPQSAERITSVAPVDFDALLGRLGKRGYLTFDDGYLDNLTTAVPILEKHDRKATVFVTCGFIDKTTPPLERVAGRVAVAEHNAGLKGLLAELGILTDDAQQRFDQLFEALKPRTIGDRLAWMQRLMSACDCDVARLTDNYLDIDQLQALARHPLITIGAHTYTHPDLRYASDAELVHELRRAKENLEDWIGDRVDTLAYPYGDTDARVRRMAANTGYRSAYVVERPNWRSRLPGYGRLDRPRVDLSSAVRRMHKHVDSGKIGRI